MNEISVNTYECTECGEQVPFAGLAFKVKNYCCCLTCEAESQRSYDREYARTKNNDTGLDKD
jgi:hypothetical protein